MANDESEYDLESEIKPSTLSLGVTYEGAIVEGSFQIVRAKWAEVLKVERFDTDSTDGLEVIDLLYHGQSGHGGQIWKFRVLTDKPMDFDAYVLLATDLGGASTFISLTVKPGLPPGGKVLFCESPFNAHSDNPTYANLNLITRELQVQTNATHELPEDLSPYHIVVLHGNGLQLLVRNELTRLVRYLGAGGRVVVLASAFTPESVNSANHLTKPHGIWLDDSEDDEVLCDRQHITDHFATKGIERLRWFRPTLMTVEPSARILVHHPERPEKGFVACGGPHENLFVIGSSFLESLVCVGWPFDNGRLLANLLMKQ